MAELTDAAVDAQFLDEASVTPQDKCILMLIARLHALEGELDALKSWRDKFMAPAKKTQHPIPHVEDLIRKYTLTIAAANVADIAAKQAAFRAEKPTWVDHLTPESSVIEAAQFITREDAGLVTHARGTVIHYACILLNGIRPTCPDVILDEIEAKIAHAMSCVSH